MNDFYEQAWLYDLVHQKSPGSEPIGFYERAIERFGQPVLELASGTGDFLVTLTENDFDISGTEKFREPAERARDKAGERNVETNLYAADMRDFNLGRKFKLIFVAGNSLQHLKTNAEALSCFASARRHLLPDGKFIIEVFNPSVALLSRDPAERFFVGEYRTPQGWVIVETNVRYDAAAQVNHIDWHYRNQYSKSEQTVSFTMRQYFPLELDALCEHGGFRIDAKFGDFDESPFSSDSPKQIIVASAA